MIATEAQAREFCEGLCGDGGLARLERFAAMLREENARQNLVSAASLDIIWQRHLADSLQLLRHVPRETSAWLDLGSGAGFPGLVLALSDAERKVTLVESRKRRVEWLEAVVREFELRNCQVFGDRLENVETFPAGAITARAFAPLDKLLRLSARFSTPSSYWVLPKGRSAAQELSDQTAQIRAMFHVEQSLTDADAAILVAQGRPRIR